MEADAIINMVEYKFCHRYFIIDLLLCDYDKTMLCVLKNQSRSTWYQVLKSYKGKIDKETLV